jgi:hypothetical protein
MHGWSRIAVFALALGCIASRPRSRPPQQTIDDARPRPSAIEVIESMGTRASLVVVADLGRPHRPQMCVPTVATGPSRRILEPWCGAQNSRAFVERIIGILLGTPGPIALSGLDEEGWLAAGLFEPLGVDVLLDESRPWGFRLENHGVCSQILIPATDPEALAKSILIGGRRGAPKRRGHTRRETWSLRPGVFVSVVPEATAVRLTVLEGASDPRGTPASTYPPAPMPERLPRTPAYQALAQGNAHVLVHWRPWLLSDLHATTQAREHPGPRTKSQLATLVTRAMGAAGMFPPEGAELDDHALVVRGDRDGFEILHVASMTPRGETAFGLLDTAVGMLPVHDETALASVALWGDLGRTHELLPHPMLGAGSTDLSEEIHQQEGLALPYAFAHAPVATLRTLLGGTDRGLRLHGIQIVATHDGGLAAALVGKTEQDVRRAVEAYPELGSMPIEIVPRDDVVVGLVGVGEAPRAFFDLAEAPARGVYSARIRLANGPVDVIQVEYRPVPGALVGHAVGGSAERATPFAWPTYEGTHSITPFTTVSPGDRCLREATVTLIEAFGRMGHPPVDLDALMLEMLQEAAASFRCALRDARSVGRARLLLRVLGLGLGAGTAPELCALFEDEALCARGRAATHASPP